MNTRKYTFIVILLSIILAACSRGSGGSGGGGSTGPTSINLWTWVSGSDTVGQSGVYGVLGTADPANVPGARQGAATWKDSSGNLWLFGGFGLDDGADPTNTSAVFLNDLWRWDITNKEWTWVSGSNIGNQSGIYGTANDVPGAREHAISWIDASGNLWLFGGKAPSTNSWFNDLWKWDVTTQKWTWESGSNTVNQNGTYGTTNDFPGSRQNAVSWTDTNGKLWLFGGYGLAGGTAPKGYLNDLWYWDIVSKQWTWIAITGTDARNNSGIYSDPTPANNVPGGRQAAASWIDSNGKLWLFGGFGYDSGGSLSQLNDLWRWDGTYWTWISGSDTVESLTNPDVQHGIYGTRGTANANNIPGARYASTVSTDSSGRVWLFGGQGLDSDLANTVGGQLNDLWRWDGTNWIWISGSNTVNQVGIYSDPTPANNVPGARVYGMSWTDSSGNFWLFGGYAYDGSGGLAEINDLWRYQP